MRLIDADKLQIKHFVQRGDQPIGYEGTQPLYDYTDLIAYDVDNAPTVKAIPLDKPFCKMVYGDYVVYNKKWLVNHLQTEWNILQGKEYKPAIPVEWIEKWVITKFVGAGRVIDSMLEDWGKENDNKHTL